jgi:hypothetical protein
MRTLASLALIAIAGLPVPAALAATPAPAVEPPVAVVGTVVSRESAWQGGRIVTRARVRVERVMRGQAPAMVEVTTLGGRVGDIAQIASRTPRIPAGPRVALELWPERDGETWRLGSVLEPVASATDEAASLSIYVRATNKDSDPPCSEAFKEVFWPIADVHWVLDEACSADVPIDDCEAAVMASFQTWQDVPCAYLAFPYDGRIPGLKEEYNADGSNLNVVKWYEVDWPGTPNQQALTLTTVGCKSGRLLDADMILNGENGTFTTSPVVGEGLADIQNTITHEAGHVAGFAHSPDTESTMFETASHDEIKKRDLTADDAQGLCDVYPLGHEPGKGGGGGCGCRAAGGAGAGARESALPALFAVGLAAAFAARPPRRRRPPRGARI